MKVISLIILLFTQIVSTQIDADALLGVPRVTTTALMNAIITPAEGAIVYNEQDQNIYVYDGSIWKILAGDGSGSLTTTLVTVDESFLWAGQVNDPDIHLNNNPLTLLETRADTGWTFTAPNTVSYTGSPDHVRIDAMVVANNTGNHWAHVHIMVYRNGTEIGEGSGLYMDDSATYSGRTTTRINLIDESPGANPVYTFVTFEDDNRTMNNPTIVNSSPISLKAIEKTTVIQTVVLN